MSGPFPSKLQSFAVVSLALVAGVALAWDDPEPPLVGKEEPAAPAVDLEKAKNDKNLAVQAARNETASTSNLSKIGIAVHEYHDARGFLPDDVKDKKGKALLSWRVAILPYLGQKKLYEEFDLAQPWDSKHNKKLLAKMPDVFRSPRVKLAGKGNTVYQAFHGPDAVFGRGQPMRFQNVTDGTSNTIMAVEGSVGVPWTKPGGIPFKRGAGLPDFGKAYGKRPLAVLFDGGPRLLDLNKNKPATVELLIDPQDGKPLKVAWD